MKCEVIVDWESDRNGELADPIECGRPAQFCDGGCWMCFTCARAMRDEGDILTPRGERRFAEIERVVYALPS
jgi:hypothetical protein